MFVGGVRSSLVCDGMEVAGARRSRRITERRLMVGVPSATHHVGGAGWQTLHVTARVRRVGRLSGGCPRTTAEHVRLVPGRELFADSLAVLQYGQRRRTRLDTTPASHVSTIALTYDHGHRRCQ